MIGDDGMATAKVVIRADYRTNTVVIYRANRQWGYGPDDALSWPEPIRRKRDGSVDCEGYLDDFIGCDGFGMVDIGKVTHVGDVHDAQGRVVASRWTVEVG